MTSCKSHTKQMDAGEAMLSAGPSGALRAPGHATQIPASASANCDLSHSTGLRMGTAGPEAPERQHGVRSLPRKAPPRGPGRTPVGRPRPVTSCGFAERRPAGKRPACTVHPTATVVSVSVRPASQRSPDCTLELSSVLLLFLFVR